ncbi:hypothetical protein [Dinoroseobacter sp. S76]|uniref:hypothetical protein n=1 Tax=Dinoroseobacter sp. S76 TaxID=3415124 RepID=UPI003C7B6EC9
MDEMQDDGTVQIFSSDVRFQCPACNADVEARMSVPEPNWSTAEDISELQSDDISHVYCRSCESEFEVYVYFTHGECSANFQEFPDASIDVDPPMFWPPQDDWSDPGSTPYPYSVYKESYCQLCELLASLGEDHGQSLINRMIFAQHVSAMEAYLCDTLVNSVTESEDARSKLISADKTLREAKLPLVDVAKGEEAVKRFVTGYLKKLLYHDLKKIDSLYRSALGVPILTSNDDNKALLHAVVLRHDCVHRNGSSPEGDPPTAFTKDYVGEIAAVIKGLIERIEDRVLKF